MDASLLATIASLGTNRVSGLGKVVFDTQRLKHKMPWYEAAKVGLLTSISPDLGQAYIEEKLGRQLDWEQRQAVRKYAEELMTAAQSKTEAQQNIINRQLAQNIQALNIAKAQSGAFRTGGRLSDIKQMQESATRAVAEVGAENVMQAKAMATAYEQDLRDYNLKLAAMESAKMAGDTETASAIASSLAKSGFFDKLLGLQQPEQETPSQQAETTAFFSKLIGYEPLTIQQQPKASLWNSYYFAKLYGEPTDEYDEDLLLQEALNQLLGGG